MDVHLPTRGKSWRICSVLTRLRCQTGMAISQLWTTETPWVGHPNGSGDIPQDAGVIRCDESDHNLLGTTQWWAALETQNHSYLSNIIKDHESSKIINHYYITIINHHKTSFVSLRMTDFFHLAPEVLTTHTSWSSTRPRGPFGSMLCKGSHVRPMEKTWEKHGKKHGKTWKPAGYLWNIDEYCCSQKIPDCLVLDLLDPLKAIHSIHSTIIVV